MQGASVSSSGPAADSWDPLPRGREELLESIDEQRAGIYWMVRTILDDLEAVAPWEGLYYPPTGVEEFLSMETALLGMIEDIPQRVAALTRNLLETPANDRIREAGENLEFYFQGIQMSVASELEKLKKQLEAYQVGTASSLLSTDERTFLCEISADLKGKYTSSIMGAAASLVADGRWNSIEIEPLLFPEKAEEFERNERLIETLSVVTESIGNFLDLVPMLDMVASWKQQQRVDQYALAPIYTLLGNLGQLMQVRSRRALYSGDYHQIRRRESLLSIRFNQLTTLHNMTWGTVADGEDRSADLIYPAMIQKTIELAAVLDVDILKKIISDKAVKDLLAVVTIEKTGEAGQTPGDDRRRSVDDGLQSLVPLLYDEDLKTFLELLLGSVLKRASLAIQRESLEPAPVEPAPPAGGFEADPAATGFDAGEAPPPVVADAGAPAELLEPLPAEFDFVPEPPEPESIPAGSKAPTAPPVDQGAARLEALQRLSDVLQPLLSRNGAHRKSFELVKRLLKQQRVIPAGLLDSMRPYLQDLMTTLIPSMRDDAHLVDLFTNYGVSLSEQCQVLSDPNMSPDSPGADVPGTMDKVLDLLNRLGMAIRGSIEALTTEIEADPFSPR